MIADARHRRPEDRARALVAPPISRHPATRAVATVAAACAIVLGLTLPFSGHWSARASQELVRNGGFEKGLKAWAPTDRERTVSVSKDAHSGEGAAVLKSKVTGPYALRDRPNTITSTPDGATYRATAWVKGSDGMSVSLRVREVQQNYVPGTRVRELVAKQTADAVLPDREWHRLTLVYRAGSGHQLDLGVFAWNGVPGQMLTVDDVSLVQVAEDEQPGPTRSSPDPSDTGPAKPNEVTPTPEPTATTQEPTPEPSQPGPSQTEPAEKGSTLFGYSTWANSGESWLQAVERRDKDFGRADVIRVFYPGLPAAWPGNAGKVGRDVVVSFKAPPAAIIAGTHDARLLTWFSSAPTDRRVYWSYYHEPEDNIAAGEYTADQYRQAWRHLAELAAQAKNPELRSTLILMSWSVNPKSGRNWKDYYPGSDVIDVLGWDAYNDASKPATPVAQRRYDDPAKIFGPSIEASRSVGKPFGFAEWASLLVPGDDGSDRAAWIRAAAAYQAEAGSVYSTYFDCPIGVGDYRITDSTSADALKDFLD